jgi:signal transduction histidine kinase
MQSKGGFNQVQYFDALLVGIVWTISFIIMMNEKLQSEIVETKELLLVNISDLKKSEEKLHLKNEELEKLIAERDRFYSIVAHDLRSPFNSFLGLTQVLADGYSGMTMEEIEKIARNLEKSAINLFGLLENLLSWSLAQQGLMQFQPRLVVLVSEVEECTILLLQQAKKKSLAINTNIDSRILVFADTGMLKTVLRNVLSNAIKFSLAGGEITVTASERADGWTEICIMDTGIGMPLEVRDKLFIDKSHLPRKGTAGEPGTGLGLMLCSEFIAIHKGKIRIDSAPEKGTAFYVSLPPMEEELAI